MRPTGDLSQVISLVQRGDHDAFGALYDELAGLVFGVIKRVLRDSAMAEEVTQEVFVEIWKSAPRYDSTKASVRTWVVTMARRRAIDRVRTEQSQRNRIDELAELRPDAPAAPADDVMSTIETELVRAALATLPDDQREVIQLAFIDGLPHGAIAERLGLPLGTVKGRVRGGLKRLREQLKERS